MAASRAVLASTAFLLALSASAPDVRGEAAATIAPAPTSTSTSAGAASHRFPPGCAVALDGGRVGARWYMPRANLVVVNRSPHRIALRMEARIGIEAAATELGFLEAGEARTFLHVVPAGRTAVLARRGEDGMTDLRQPIYIWNYGPLTCQRRFVWILR